jgi:hypothetical protein
VEIYIGNVWILFDLALRFVVDRVVILGEMDQSLGLKLKKKKKIMDRVTRYFFRNSGTNI